MLEQISPLDSWLKDVGDDALVIDESETGIEHEAQGNLWSFSISADQARALTKAEIRAFLDAIIEVRRQQIKQVSGEKRLMTFYCWYDEQANHLRFSLVSASHGRLPFGTHVEECKNLEGIVEHFLTSTHHNGLPVSDFETHPSKNHQDGFALVPDRPQVWTKRLP